MELSCKNRGQFGKRRGRPTKKMLEELNGWIKGFEPFMELEETEGSATVSIKIGDAFDSFEVTTVENPVESIEILDPLAVNKSYPAFYEDFKKLGGTVHGI